MSENHPTKVDRELIIALNKSFAERTVNPDAFREAVNAISTIYLDLGMPPYLAIQNVMDLIDVKSREYSPAIEVSDWIISLALRRKYDRQPKSEALEAAGQHILAAAATEIVKLKSRKDMSDLDIKVFLGYVIQKIHSLEKDQK